MCGQGQSFLWGSEDRWFRFEKIVQEATNKLIEHVSGATVQV